MNVINNTKMYLQFQFPPYFPHQKINRPYTPYSKLRSHRKSPCNLYRTPKIAFRRLCYWISPLHNGPYRIYMTLLCSSHTKPIHPFQFWLYRSGIYTYETIWWWPQSVYRWATHHSHRSASSFDIIYRISWWATQCSLPEYHPEILSHK